LNKSRLIKKSLNEEQRLATFIVLEPQDPDGTTSDLHGDWYSEEEVHKASVSFNRFCKKANLLHMVETNGFSFDESYVTLAEMTIEGEVIKKGTWVATVFCEDEDIWTAVKEGTLCGLSIQAMANVHTIKDNE
jgi:hypothetical protein